MLQIKTFLWSYIRAALKSFGFKRKYEVDGVVIDIDFTHRMPDYRKDHPHYDRFLVHLVQFLSDKSLVVEVGANVGYTFISMAQNNDSLEYVLFEADDNCYKDLQNNIEKLRKINKNVSVNALKQFVGLDIDNVSLEPYAGSNHAVLDGGGIFSKSLVESFNELGLDSQKLSLLISDVDGYDWDVIRSSYDLLEHNPYLYFECWYLNESQHQNFNKLFQELSHKGYSGFVFFDNYGQYMCTVTELSQVESLLDYIAKQNFNTSTRTMYYYDVLAFSNDKSAEVSKIIDGYRSF